MNDIPDNAPHLDPAVDDAIALSVLDAVEQLIQERTALEQFAEEKYRLLTQLREQVRAQNATAENELRKQLETSCGERDAALVEVEALTEEVRRARLNEQLANDELAQMRQQTEQQRRQSGELQRLLDVLREEVARQEQRQRAEAERHAQLEKEHAELKELMHGFEQAEVELRQEQDALRKERDRLPGSNSGRVSISPNISPNIVIGAGDQRLLNFACKHCGGTLQVKEHLAGLITRCSHCSKMAPVPKMVS